MRVAMSRITEDLSGLSELRADAEAYRDAAQTP